MRIAFFVWEFWPRLIGGLGTYSIEITKKFKELNNDVSIFTMNDGNLKTNESWGGIEIYRPLVLDASNIFLSFVGEDLKKWGENIKFFSDVYGYNFLSAIEFINELIKKRSKEFDIVVVHDWLSFISGLIIRKNLKDIPIVSHFHSTDVQRNVGSGSEVIRFLENTMAKESNRIITVSNSMKDHLISMGYPIDKIEVCYNACDPEKYNPSKVDNEKLEKLKNRYGIKSGERVILFVGRLIWIKGVNNLIQSMPCILKEFPETKLVILGKGEEYNNLIEQAKKLKIIDKIVIRSEWVPEEERILHYALADVCVFPSLSEPFGIVSLEAMSMKKPVVVGASGINGLKEQVIPSGKNRTGVHVDGNSPEDIAWGVKEVLRNFDEAKKWGENGRKRVLEKFTWDISAKNTLEIYRKVIE